MRVKSNHTWALLVLVLSMAILACTLSPGISKPDAQPPSMENEAETGNNGQNGNSTSAPGETGSESEGLAEPLPPLDLTNLEEFDIPAGVSTFRLNYLLSLMVDGQAYSRVSGGGVVSLEDQRVAVTKTSERAGDENPTTFFDERQLINDYSVTQSDGSCFILNLNVLPFDPKESRISMHFSSDLPRNYLTGKAEFAESGLTVNGRPAIRYTLEKKNFDLDPDPLMILSYLELGEVYIDEEAGTLLRVSVKGTGQLFGPISWSPIGEIQYELNYTEFDQSVEAEPLTDCDPEIISRKTQFPIFEPYLMVRTSKEDTNIEFSTYAALQDVIDFYKTTLPEQGWTLTEEVIIGEEDVSLNFRNGNDQRMAVDLSERPGPASSDRGPTIFGTLFIFDF